MLSEFNVVKPQTVEEALTYLERKDHITKVLAGGTDLLVILRRSLKMPDLLLDIKGIEETKRLEFTSGVGLFVGASVTVNQVADSEIIQRKYQALGQAAQTLGSYQVRNRATLVGNICNASPGADLAAPLLVYEANVHIASKTGRRTIPLTEFFTGVKKTALASNELVVGISLPDPSSGDQSVYLRQARIKGHDLGIVGVAVRLTAYQRFLVAISAVAPTPVRLFALEESLNDQWNSPEIAVFAGEEIQMLIHPISDVRASAEYRLHIAGVLVKRAVALLTMTGGT